MAELAHIGPGDHRGHPGRLPRARRLQPAHPRVRMRAPHEGHVEEPGHRDVVGVAARAEEEHAILHALHAPADIRRLVPGAAVRPAVRVIRHARGHASMSAMPRRAKVIRLPTRKPPAAAPGERDLVVIQRCRDQGEALVVRGLLDSMGISSVLRGNLVSSLHPFSVGAQGEIAVLVHEFDVPRARAALSRR